MTLLGGAAATWPLAARAQQPALPVVGLLSGGTQKDDGFRIDAFRQGLAETGFTEDRNVAFTYRGAGGSYDQLPELASELVRARVAVLVSLGPTLAGLAAKAASTTVPIVFYVGADPIKVGLVSSLNRPGGNVTGFSQMFNVIVAKQFELLRQAVPNADPIVFLANPANSNAKPDTADAQAAAHTLGQNLVLAQASTIPQLDDAFAMLRQRHAGAVLVAADVLFRSHVDQFAALALRYGLPMLTSWRECTAAGGLLSYGASQADGHRQQGIYVGRILKGDKPADLPVVLPTKFELALNLKTAKALGLSIPLAVQVAADEVIE
jgi:putative tryptophan/tyrosine transport system substrate-binding protein